MIKRANFPGITIAALSTLTLSLGISQQPVQAEPSVTSSLRFEEVMEACRQRGYVNLVAGAAKNGAAICQDGSPHTSIQYKEYADMMAHWLAASFLVGARRGAGSNLDQVVAWANTPEGKASLDQAIQKGTDDPMVLPQPYRDRMTQEIYYFLGSSQRMRQLVGTQREYAIVVKNFCSPKGKPLSAVQKLVPNLTVTQVYAVCAMEDQTANP